MPDFLPVRVQDILRRREPALRKHRPHPYAGNAQSGKLRGRLRRMPNLLPVRVQNILRRREPALRKQLTNMQKQGGMIDPAFYYDGEPNDSSI